jgi:hypothetical protein
MFDLNSAKVFGALCVNVTLGVFASLAPWVANFDALSKSFLTVAQIGVAVVTIVYIAFKIRNERRK